METGFYIDLNIKTTKGYQLFGKYYLGKNRELANEVFNKLKGTRQVSDKNVLQLDFIEKVDGLPFNLQVLGCTLAELSENCSTITREIFKIHNLL
jgi:hypothetical protein